MSSNSQEPTGQGHAFGKVILMGEHAVVYGEPALAGALSLGLHCEAWDADRTSLSVPAWHLQLEQEDEHPVMRAILRMMQAAKTSPRRLLVNTELPAQSGLGSSAALCVAVSRAIGRLDRNTEQEIANLGEASFHERPSGIDVAISSKGGLGVFQKGHGLRAIAAAPVPIVVALSGVPRSTRAMVERVAQAHERGTAKEHLHTLGQLTMACVDALVAKDWKELGALFDRGHAELRELGVSHEQLDAMQRLAKETGALGAKLTGAGGGGALIALCEDVVQGKELVSTFAQQGYKAFHSEVGAS